jgi:hypothetical protein
MQDGTRVELLLSPHGPLRLQLVLERVRREDDVARETADAARTVADGAELSGGDAAAVAADRARLAASVVVDELARRSKVKTREGAGLAQQMAVGKGQRELAWTDNKTRGCTYGLGNAASSSKAFTRGLWTGMLTLYGRRSPMGL